jgi:hypothetical protein
VFAVTQKIICDHNQDNLHSVSPSRTRPMQDTVTGITQLLKSLHSSPILALTMGSQPEDDLIRYIHDQKLIVDVRGFFLSTRLPAFLTRPGNSIAVVRRALLKSPIMLIASQVAFMTLLVCCLFLQRKVAGCTNPYQIYDYLLTLNREISLVWYQPKWTYTKIIFLMARYLPIPAIILTLYSKPGPPYVNPEQS